MLNDVNADAEGCYEICIVKYICKFNFVEFLFDTIYGFFLPNYMRRKYVAELRIILRFF